MDSITKRLHENKQVSLAKEILENAGYKVTKRVVENASDSIIATLPYSDIYNFEQYLQTYEDSSSEGELRGETEVWEKSAEMLGTTVQELVSLDNPDGEFFAPYYRKDLEFPISLRGPEVRASHGARFSLADIGEIPCVYVKEPEAYYHIILHKKYTKGLPVDRLEAWEKER